MGVQNAAHIIRLEKRAREYKSFARLICDAK